MVRNVITLVNLLVLFNLGISHGDQSIIAHWNFNGSNGDSAYDISGNNNHLRLYNGVTWTKTGNGYGIQLDGEDDICMAASKANLNGFTALTAEAVFMITKYNTKDQFTVIVDKWGPAGSLDDSWACDLYNKNVNGLYGIIVGESKYRKLYSHNKLPLNTWIHLVLVWTGDNLTFYVNGKQDVSCAVNGISAIKSTDASIRVGNGADMNNGFCGIIDNIILYNYALSPDTIKSHCEGLGIEELKTPVAENGNCGGPKSGAEMAFIPALFFGLSSLFRRKKSK